MPTLIDKSKKNLFREYSTFHESVIPPLLEAIQEIIVVGFTLNVSRKLSTSEISTKTIFFFFSSFFLFRIGQII